MSNEHPTPRWRAAEAQAAQRRTFGANVREQRVRAGMTQDQLATTAGLNRTYVISIEKGRQNLSLQAIWLIAHAIGVRPETFFTDRDDDARPPSMTMPSDA